MSDKLLKAIIGKARKAIDETPVRLREKDKIMIINRKVRMGREECKEILKILKKS